MMNKMVVTDLDGTLALKGIISARAIETLRELGERSIVRVIATGRSLEGARKVLTEHFPIDYLVFSSGAGVFDFRRREVMRAILLEPTEVHNVARVLTLNNLDFMVHDPIPENHLFAFHHNDSPCPDFLRRLERHRPYSRPLALVTRAATQFLVVHPPHLAAEAYATLKALLPQHSIIRTTSPLDGESVWLELFAANVCKSEACDWICQRLNIARDHVLAIGNDYNDVDLLKWAGSAAVMEDCPADLAREFRCLHGTGPEGFSEAVRDWMRE